MEVGFLTLPQQFAGKVIFLRLLENAQMQVEPSKSRLRGRSRCFSPADQAGNPESGVTTNKE